MVLKVTATDVRIRQATNSLLAVILGKGVIRLAIDPDFRKKRKKAGEEEGIAIWGPVNPPEELGIRGTAVWVDWDICGGCGICLEVCPGGALCSL